MALNESSPEQVSDAAAAPRMRSLLRRVSARLGLTDPVVIVVTSRTVPRTVIDGPLSGNVAERITIR
ncbi:hypothetical protein GCM10023320_48200 [Pseudonocardia adelaidensis]|uniref:Uncharacterized protein n=1 Tax=Pseudonocardia adelaidensis TaxID=648754 RepID=A0ABP9NRW7_9PSEU